MSELTGILKMKGEETQVSEKFKKREFVVTDANDMYPQHIAFQLTQDKCSLLDMMNVGDQVKVTFNIRGREWTSPQGEVKYFNTLEAWRLEKVGNGNPMGGAMSEMAMPTASSPIENAIASNTTAEDEDDLPF